MRLKTIKNQIGDKYCTKYVFKIIELLKNKLNISKSAYCYYLGRNNYHEIFLCLGIVYFVYIDMQQNKDMDLAYQNMIIKSLYSIKLLVKDPKTEKDIEFSTIISIDKNLTYTTQEFLNWIDEPCRITENVDNLYSDVIYFLNNYQKGTFRTKDYIFYIKKDNNFSLITNFYAYDIKNKATMKLYALESWDKDKKIYLPPTCLKDVAVEVLHGKLSTYQQRKCKLEFLKYANQFTADENFIVANYWLMELVKQTVQPVEYTRGWCVHRVFAGIVDGEPKEFTNIWVEDFPNIDEEPSFLLTDSPTFNITKVAVLNFKTATYHSTSPIYKSGCVKYKRWDLDSNYLKNLVEFFKSPVDEKCYYTVPRKYVKTNWQKLIFEYNHNTAGWGWGDTGFDIPPEKDSECLYDIKALPFNLPMPDYTKITYPSNL